MLIISDATVLHLLFYESSTFLYRPSAYNEQPWRFFVAKTPQDKEMLMEYMMPSEKEWIAAAPVLILLAGNMGDTHNGLLSFFS